MEVLRVEKLNVHFGMSQVLRDVSLTVNEGETIYLVGRNGAGKTTTLRSILGFVTPTSGKIIFKGDEITNLPPHERAKMGIGYAPEDRRIFPDLTIDENIKIAAWFSKGDREENIKFAYSFFPELKKMKNRLGMLTSGGEQKMIAVARALTLRANLLLLDEPLEGLAPALVERLVQKLNEIKSMGVSMLVAESNLSLVPEFAERLYVIERGEIIYEGEPKEVYESEEVMKIIRGF